LQTEVSTLSPQVGFYDHRRALLTAENVLLKQKLAALGQSQRYKEGECGRFYVILYSWFCKLSKEVNWVDVALLFYLLCWAAAG
jgi:hypothetical protein